ncbi:pyrrolo-quinoline quinone [Halorubrum coriense DSM 10284]|uniref:Pyrrolo-quinoline quinone n=2 Tax=Halorubrum coriense TaxID=64713 RepID=M0EV56_9EURY|nr:pyrrolo-quinoline quinone [Halorubrum coriense DSM 10284]
MLGTLGHHDDWRYAGQTVDPETRSNQRWVFETGDSIQSSPTVVDGTAFIGSKDEHLYAVNVETGDQQWAFETDGWVNSSPAVVDGIDFFGSDDGYLYAVNAETGDEQWFFNTGDLVRGSLTVAEKTVFVGSADQNLYAVDVKTGKQQWQFKANVVSILPVVADSTVFITGGSLYAVDAETGDQQWQFVTTGGVHSSPTVRDGTVFFVSGNETLYAVDAETGDEQWAAETGAPIRSSPTVADGTVFVGSAEGTLYAVDEETGNQQWVFSIGDRLSSPTVVDDLVFVGSETGNLYAVDTNTGAQQWSSPTATMGLSSPIVVDGTIFVGSGDGNLYAIGSEVEGSSDDSRVLFGSLGHHDDWRYANQSITIPASASYLSTLRDNTELLTVGGVGIVSAVGGTYVLHKRSQNSAENSPDESKTQSSPTSDSETTQSVPSTEESETDGSADIDTLRSEAETAVDTAISARKTANYTEAVDAYNKALTQYQAALKQLDTGSTERRTTIETAIDSVRTDLEAIKARSKQRDTLIELLDAAEQSFQVAIVAYVQGSQTLARIRFRQARNNFEEAMAILEESDDLLTPTVEVSVQPDRELASTTLSALPVIPKLETEALADAGVETLGDLESSTESPWTPPTVETLATNGMLNAEAVTTLTFLSWWNTTDNYEFDTLSTVSRRRDQADYGFTQSSNS